MLPNIVHDFFATLAKLQALCFVERKHIFFQRRATNFEIPPDEILPNFLRRVRESATAAPKAHGGGARRRLDAAGEERLRKLWAEDPDATIAQLCVRYVKRHRLPLSPATVGRTLSRLGRTQKKVAPCDRTGQRAVDATPKNWGDNVTLCAALTLRGLMAPLFLPGAMRGVAFTAYVEQFLVPELRPGDVVVLDNLSAHKGSGLSSRVEAAGARLVSLPPYSPDFNPIELCWSKVKTLLRRAQARTVKALLRAVTVALRSVTAQDALGRFQHNGHCGL